MKSRRALRGQPTPVQPAYRRRRSGKLRKPDGTIIPVANRVGRRRWWSRRVAAAMKSKISFSKSAAHPPGLSVQDLVDSLDDAQLEIKRKTLVVRLHRMVQAGRLAPQGHGNYTLSEAERSRRRA